MVEGGTCMPTLEEDRWGHRHWSAGLVFERETREGQLVRGD